MGYSRAVRVGDRVFVAGTAPIMADGGDPPTDAYGQTKRCLEIVEDALEQAGASLADVVRTRVLPDPRRRLRRLRQGARRGVLRRPPREHDRGRGGLLDPRWLLEIEVEAVVTAPA